MLVGFIWGRANKVLGVYEDTNAKCEVCSHDSLNYIVTQHYIHIFWIPIFPLAKVCGSYCDNCDKSIIESYSQEASKYDKKTRTPIYMYSWSIVLLALIIAGIFNGLFYLYQKSDIIKDPLVGDVYLMKVENEKKEEGYLFLKVIKVTKDSLFLYHGNYIYDQKMSEFSFGDYFIKSLVGKSRNEISELDNKNIIVDVFRDYKERTGFNIER
jgi:hypothetical protein